MDREMINKMTIMELDKADGKIATQIIETLSIIIIIAAFNKPESIAKSFSDVEIQVDLESESEQMNRKMNNEMMEELEETKGKISTNKIERSFIIIIIAALLKLNKPESIAKSFSDIEVQFDYSVPVARTLNVNNYK